MSYEYDKIYEALELGMPKEILYETIRMSEDSFWWYIECRKFTPSMIRKMIEAINQWYDENQKTEKGYPEGETE